MAGSVVYSLRKERWLPLLVPALLLVLAAAASAMNDIPGPEHQKRLESLKAAAAVPNTQNCSHRVGNVHFTITNWGFFGSNFADQWDALVEDYCLGPGVTQGEKAPSFEFPAGTGINYLYAGGLWIGAIVNQDTLVSTGTDGWQRVNEMYPAAAPDGGIIQLSNRKTSEYYSPDAVSEQDYFAEYTDTLSDQAYTGTDAVDNRPHVPLNVKVLQRSYSWSYSYAEDFVLLDFKVVNMGMTDLRKAYMAIYIDADIWNGILGCASGQGFDDDMTGYLHAVSHPACKSLDDSINIAWTADFDGDPGWDCNAPGVFAQGRSPLGVAGTRVVRSPTKNLQFSFNWWVSNGDASLDWGPRRVENNRDFGTGGLGTPEGDRNKYYMISRREFDYDQMWSAVDLSADGWLPPNAQIGSNLADGYDTRYLFSFGPFDIEPGDTLPVTIAYIAGDHFHTDPKAVDKYWDPLNPQPYYDQLNFTDFGINAEWAGWVYDSPGIDTDGDNYAGDKVANPCSPGDSIYITGDGVPDFAGPPPPSPPILRFSASPGSITLRWNGKAAETDPDPFSFVADFEGYQMYLGDKLQLSRFALLTTYDRQDYDMYQLNTNLSPVQWELTHIPYTLAELQQEFPDIPNFNPGNYPRSDSLTEMVDGVPKYYYFQPHGYNRSHLGGPGEIRKVYPNASDSDLVWSDELNDFVYAKYEYEYTISGMLPSQPVYMAVTTKDFGNPQTSLAPLESSPLANAIEVYPIWSNKEVESQDLKVAVFPNPYKINGGYLEAGYEKLTTQDTSPERARRIHFANLPAKAKIRIYTLDGDLVRELNHPCDCPLQEGESMMAWDLISRNTQAVVSGIYLYTIESDAGNQVGKFVIIK
jgi:hypothetical protein